MVNMIDKGNILEYRLSPSSLNLMQDCPRCFWLLMMKNIKRPLGPMSSIPIKMDSIIKNYFDRYRGLNELPPILQGKIAGRLSVNMPKTLVYREENGILLLGRPDDYLELKDGNIVVLDHKTASKAPEKIHYSYNVQLNTYSYLLKMVGYKTTNKAYLAYYYPDDCELHRGMPFNCTIIEIETQHSVVKELISKAYDILIGSIPNSGKNCEYCKWKENT
jgi:hypothetical protein